MVPSLTGLEVLVLIGGVLQTIYLTILILTKFAGVSNRIAVMEFQVAELWKRSSPPPPTEENDRAH